MPNLPVSIPSQVHSMDIPTPQDPTTAATYHIESEREYNNKISQLPKVYQDRASKLYIDNRRRSKIFELIYRHLIQEMNTEEAQQGNCKWCDYPYDRYVSRAKRQSRKCGHECCEECVLDYVHIGLSDCWEDGCRERLEGKDFVECWKGPDDEPVLATDAAFATEGGSQAADAEIQRDQTGSSTATDDAATKVKD